MRWLVWCVVLAAGACARSKSESDAEPGSSAGTGGASVAGSGGAPVAGGGSGGDAGAGRHAGGRASGGFSSVGGSGGRSTSGAAGSDSGGEAGGGIAGSASASGGMASAGEGSGGEAGAPVVECGTYDACGCGCCGGATPTPTCYYPERGDELASIIAADQAQSVDPGCESAGCSLGARHLCCVTPEPSAGIYAARAIAGGFDRLTIERRGSGERCAALTLVSPVSGGQLDFPLEAPSGWALERTGESACEDGTLAPPGRPAAGGIGSVSYSTPEPCALDFDFTLFFLSDTGEVEPVRFQGEGVPLTGAAGC